MKKSTKRKLIIIPLTIMLLVLGGIYLVSGWGGFLWIFASVDRTDMMDEFFYGEFVCRIYVPDGPGAYPLVLHLHGGGQCGTDNRQQTKKSSVMQTLLSKDNLKKYPCIALAPQCTGDWEPDALRDLLEYTIENYAVDPARIYITGFSKGGHGVWDMLAAHPEYIAAAVPACGWGDPEAAPRFRDVAVWAFHGRRDPEIDAEDSRRIVRALEEAGSTKVKYTEYPLEAHQCYELAWRETDLFPWMFAQAKAGQG